MSPRAIAKRVVPIGALAALLALPSSGQAASGAANQNGSGGASLSAPPAPNAAAAPSSPNATAPPGTTQPGSQLLTVTGPGITISSRAFALLRGQLRITGHVRPALGGATMVIERRGRQTAWRWTPTVSAPISGAGTFTALWKANHIGRFAIRAVLEPPAPVRAAVASPTLTVTVYRPSVATIFGPGFFGNETACGEILGHATLGVANRTLPCGTPVALLYRGRTLTVPVIDRGPYVQGVDWDLTSATAKALGITGTATIGAVSLPSRN